MGKAYLLSAAVHGLFFLLFSVSLFSARPRFRVDNFSEVVFAQSMPIVERPVVVRKETELPRSEPVKQQETVRFKKPEPKKEPATESGSKSQVKIDAERFPFDYYLRLLRTRIQERWNPPYQTAEGGKLNTVIDFIIQRDGSITDIRISKGSGKFLYDAAAQRAVVAVGKMPPLPDEYGENELHVTIDFEATW